MEDVNISLLDSVKGEMCETIVEEIQKPIREYKITGKFNGFCCENSNKEFHVRGLRRGRGNVIKKTETQYEKGNS
jgi:hypothetical protein